MSGGDINVLMDIWALDKAKNNDVGPFESVEHMYKVIDVTKAGDAPWKCFSTFYEGETDENSPAWKLDSYQVWYRDPDVVIHNLLDNPDFHGQFDYQPYVEVGRDGKRWYNNVMSGNFAWRHSVHSLIILQYPGD